MSNYTEAAKAQQKRWRLANADHVRAVKREYARRWAAAHREKINNEARRRYSENPEKYRLRARMQREPNRLLYNHRVRLGRYRLADSEFQKLLELQREKCAVCGEKKSLYIDHDHETGLVRGLVCQSCNILLGWIENPLRAKAESYLQNFPAKKIFGGESGSK